MSDGFFDQFRIRDLGDSVPQPRHCTTAGRIVYKRAPKIMALPDLLRMVKKIEPRAEHFPAYVEIMGILPLKMTNAVGAAARDELLKVWRRIGG